MSGVKMISELTEQAMQEHAESDIEILIQEYPDAREIDLLNAYLKAFTSLGNIDLPGDTDEEG